MNDFQSVLIEPTKAILSKVGNFVVIALGVLFILLLGWLISRLIKATVTKGLRAVKLDDLSDRIALDSLLEKGGITYSLSELIGIICYWLGILVTFMLAINAMGLTVAADLLNKVIFYIPNIVVAIFIIIIGMFVATLLRNIVLTAANNAGIAHSKILAKIVEAAIIIFTVIIALEQLQIGIRITELTIGIMLGSIGLGLALAFGLGCKDIAGKTVTELVEKLKSKK